MNGGKNTCVLKSKIYLFTYVGIIMRGLFTVIIMLIFACCTTRTYAAAMLSPRGIERLGANLTAPITQFINRTLRKEFLLR
jgi:hypothetical protein